MKLISCHVENFGRLHDFHYLFRDGLNVIFHENGWGKTTFAAFLLAMFYGMPGRGRSRGRQAGENARETYRPWQGGVYGGQIVFEAGGKLYEMTRIFGRRESEDEFDLRDPETNMPDFDFTKDIGKELFQLDRESFQRTVYTAQRDCETRATDDVNALIADLAGQAGDMGCYEEAQKTLHDAANRLTPRRATGHLYRLTVRIGQLERTASGISGMETEWKQCEQELKALRREEAALQREKEELEAEITEAAQKEADNRKNRTPADPDAGNRLILQHLQQTRAKREKQVREAAAFFPGRIPSRGEIDHYLQKCREMERLEDRMQARMLTEAEQDRLNILEERFSDRSAVGAGGERQPGAASIFSLLSAAGLFLLITGVVLLVIDFAGNLRGPAGGTAAGAALLCGAAGVLLILRALRERRQEGSADILADGTVYEITENSACGRRSGGRRSTGSARSVRDAAPCFTDRRTEARQAYEEYLYLDRKEQKLEKLHADWAEMRRSVLAFVWELGFSVSDSPGGDGPGEDAGTILSGIRDAADNYEDAAELLKEAEEDLRRCGKEKETEEDPRRYRKEGRVEEDLRDFRREKEAGEKDLPALHHRRDRIFDRQLRNREKIAEEERRMENLRAELAESESALQELEELRRQKEEDEDHYRHLVTASEILQKARDSLTSRYADPVRKHFCDYWETITGLSAAGLHVDSNSAVTLEERGRQRELAALSEGYRDLAGICLRMALADAMYTDARRDRPALIMDDPFAALDDEKIQGALRFLGSTALSWQIIYFTCSRSRTP